MKNRLNYKGYTGTIEYTIDDGVLFGKVEGIDDLVSYEGENIKELRIAFEDSVDEYLEHCASIGKEPNKPALDKHILEIDAGLYGRLSKIAREKHMSFDNYAIHLLEQCASS